MIKINIDDFVVYNKLIQHSPIEIQDRLLNSFNPSQIKSKKWLLQNIESMFGDQPLTDIVLYGGWFGSFALMLFNSDLLVDKITNVDMDPGTKHTGEVLNQHYNYQHVTANMCFYKHLSKPSLIVNTSSEHITQAEFNVWLQNQPSNVPIVIQSNDYYQVYDHVNCIDSVDQLVDNVERYVNVHNSLTLSLEKYNRFMILGITK